MAEPTLVHLTTVPPVPRIVRGCPSKIAVSPKGDLLVYPSAQVVVLLRVSDLSVVHIFREHRFETTAVRFSPNGEFIASGDRDGEVFIWQAFPPFERKYNLKNCTAGEIADIAWSPDNSKIAVVGNEGSASYMDIKTGSSGADLNCHNRRIESVVIHPDEKKKLILMASHDSRVSVFDNSKGGYRPKYANQLTAHDKEVYSVSFNAKGDIFASGGADGRLIIYNTEAQREIEGRRVNRPVMATVFVSVPAFEEGDTVDESETRKELLVYASCDGLIRALSFNKAQDEDEVDEWVEEWVNFDEGVQRLSLAASSSANCIFSANSEGRLDVIRSYSGGLVKSLHGHVGHLKAIDIDIVTGVTVTGDNSGTLCIDRGDNDGVQAFRHGRKPIRAVSILSNDGEGVIISLEINNRMEVLSLLDGSVIKGVILPSEPRAISRGRDKVAILCHKHCLLLDTKSKAILVEEELRSYEPVAVAMTSNGMEVAIGDANGVVHIYDTTNWDFTPKHTIKLRGTLTVWASNAMEYSKNGLYLAVTDASRYVNVYRREDWTLLVDDWRMHNASIKAVGWSPDGKTLATGAVDRSIIVWRLPQGGKKFDPIVQKCGHMPEALIWRSASELVTVGEDGCRIHWKLQKEDE